MSTIAAVGQQQELQEAFDNFRILRRNPDRSWRTISRLSGAQLREEGTAAAAVRNVKIALGQLPAQLFDSTDWLVQIPPMGADGFAIDVSRDYRGFVVLFGGLEMQFDTIDDVLVWVERALSAEYQLRTITAGKAPIEWRLEPVDEPQSPMVLAAGVVSVMGFFQKKSVTTRSNNLTG